MANTTKRFVHVPVKSTFISANSGWETTYEKSIIFFKDTQEIWTHGQFYAIPDAYKTRISDLETYIDNNVKNASWFNGVSVNGGEVLSTTAKGGVLNFTDSNSKFIEISTNSNGVSIDLKDELLATAEQGAKADTAIQNVNHTGSTYIDAKLNGTSIEINSTELANKIAQIESDIEAATSGGVLKITGTTNTYVKVDKETGDVALDESGLVTKIQALEQSDTDKLAEAKEYAETQADNAKNAVIGNTSDASSANTIHGAKKYADEKADAAQTNATNVSKVTIDEAAGSGDILKVYTIKQGDNTIGTINTAKDLVVTGGSIIEKEGVKYLQLTIANQEQPVEIAVHDLVDVYKGSTYIEIGANNTISLKFNELDAALAVDTTAVGAKIKEAKDAADAAQGTANDNADAITDLQDTAITGLAEGADSVDNVTIIGKLGDGNNQGSVTVAGATTTKAGVMTSAHVVALTETIPGQIIDINDLAIKDFDAVPAANEVVINGKWLSDEPFNNIATISAATTDLAGVMTATDKVNLDNCVAHSAEWDWEEL